MTRLIGRSTKIALGVFGVVLILSGCSSNQPSPPASKGSISNDLSAEESASRGQRSNRAAASPSVASVAGEGSVVSSHQEELKAIEGVSLDPSSPITGDQIKARVSLAASVQTAPEILYRWKKNGQTIQESSSDELESAVKCGDYIEVEVLSARAGDDSTKSVSNYVMVGNAPPSLKLAGQTIGNEGTYQAKVESSDPEGDNFELSIKEGPAGMTIDRSGNIRWAVDAKSEGVFAVAVSARDVHGAEVSLNYQIKIRREPNGKAS